MPTRQNATHLEVDEDGADQRLDNFLLSRLKGVPRSHVYRLIRSGQVRVNSGRARPAYRLASGDRIRIPPVTLRTITSARGQIKGLAERIVFEDDRFLVFDKPSGMAVHGGSGVSWGVIEALRELRPSHRLELAHRLDRSTSGCLLIAKKRGSLRLLHELFRDGLVEKRYLALLRGQWDLGNKPINLPLLTHTRRSGERHVTVAERGKRAISRFRAVQFLKPATLVEVSLETGRTHQIRVHAAHLGHPVAGDLRYGDSAFNKRFRKLGVKRLFLHAHSVNFQWPEDHGEVSVSVSLPEDLGQVLDALAENKV